MSRVMTLGLAIGLIAGLNVGGASALGPASTSPALVAPEQSLIIKVKPLTERQKCKALNRCRQKYTHCYNKLVAQRKDLETEKVTCVKPYQKCINASFSGFDFFFTRWFNPAYLDCRKYPN